MKCHAVGLGRGLLASSLVLLVLIAPTKVFAESESGSIGLEGRVSTSAPTSAPIISLPETDSRFDQSPITVSGSCVSDLLIKIFVNEIFSGSIMCEGGKFSLEVNLYSGENKLIARAYDDLDQAGPDSNTAVVYLDASATLRLTSKFARRSANPREVLTWPISILGGSPPYAVIVDWGDGRTSLKSIQLASEFELEHTYLYSGIYKVIVRAVDIKENKAVLQLVAVSKGTQTAPTSNTSNNETKTVVLWWPMVLFIIFMILSFWLGARYERRRSQTK